MTHALDSDDFFIHQVQQQCAEHRLNFFLVEPLWVESFLDRFRRGEVWSRALLNMHSEHHLPGDVFHRLIVLADERRTKGIDPPAIAMAAFDKAQLHPKLANAGLSAPPSIIVRREEIPAFRLTGEQKSLLGSPFVVKPSMGYGRKGVILEATNEEGLARSAAALESPAYLLQRRIVSRMHEGNPLYFRVYHVFGTIWCCWWNCFTDAYRMLSEAECQELRLVRLQEIVRQIARLTGMKFFSSEITQTDSGDLVLIDYVNDQCHMLSQSANPKMGVPDELVAAVAKRLVEGARELIRENQGR